MPIRVAAGDPRQITATFPAAATGAVQVTVESARSGLTGGPFTADDLTGGTYGYMLTSADVDDVDELTVTFTATVDGVDRRLVERVQVAGGHYFTVAEARSIGRIETTYTDAEIESARLAVEDQIEANLDTSMVARYEAETVSGNGEFIRLTQPFVLRLVRVTENDIDITDEVNLDGRYVWRNKAGTAQWAYGHRNVEVVYEKGYEEFPPEDLRRKSIEATRFTLHRERHTGSPTGVIAIGTEVGTLRMAVAGLRQPFGIPEVDAVVLKYAEETGQVL